MFQHFLRIFQIDIHPSFDHLGIEVIGPFFDDGSSLDSADELFGVVGLEVDDLFDGDEFMEEIDLPDGAGDAVEEEELLAGEITVGGNEAMDEMVPNLDGHLIGEEEPLSREVVVELAGWGLGG